MKTRLFLIFGIFVFVFGIIVIPFLIATDHSGDLKDLISFEEDSDCNFNDQVTSKSYSSDVVDNFGTIGMAKGSVTLKEGDCKANFSKLFGDKLTLIVEGGTTISRQEISFTDEFGDVSKLDRFVLTSSGGIIEINDQKLFLEKGDQLIIDKDGFVTQGKFKSIEGQDYEFAGFSIIPSEGKVDFNMDVENPFLILPEGSSLESFDEKFTDLTIEGQNIQISDALAGKMFGGASEGITISGKVEYLKLSPNPDNPSTGSKERQARYVLLVPSGEEVHFGSLKKEDNLAAGITIKSNGDFGIPIVFEKGKGTFKVDDPRDFGEGFKILGTKDYILDSNVVGDILDYVSLGDEIYVSNMHPKNDFTLRFEKGSDSGGFNLDEEGSLSLVIKTGDVFIKEGEIEFRNSNPEYKITSGPVSWVGQNNDLTISFNKEKKDSFGTEFRFHTRGKVDVDVIEEGFSINDISVLKRGDESRSELEFYYGAIQLTQEDLVWVHPEGKPSYIDWGQTFKRAAE